MTFELQPFNIYLGLAIVGVFSGLGSAIGSYIFNELVKPRLHQRLERVNGLPVRLIKRFRGKKKI